jgi:hypothetical protein
MWIRIVLGGLLSGIAVFVWGSVSWMALPWHHDAINQVTDEEAVMKVLYDNCPESGVYLFPLGPNPGKNASPQEIERAEAIGLERMKRGPTGFLVLSRAGFESVAGALLTQLATSIVAGMLMAWLLTRTRGLSGGQRIAFVVTVAVLGGILCHVPEWNFYNFSTGYTALAFMDLIVGWTLGGAVLAWVVRPRPEAIMER